MIGTFKDIFYGYIAAIAVGTFLTVVALRSVLGNGLRLVILIAIILVAAGIATWLTQRRILACNEPLENCRLKEGIGKLEKTIGKIRDKNSLVMFRLNEATAYNDLGDYDKAIEVLKNAGVPDTHSLREMSLMAIYQYQMALALMEKGELEEAELHITTLDYILGDLKFREPMLSRMIRNSKMAKQRLAVLTGDHDGACEAYKEFEESAETLRVRVACRYRLAKEYAFCGRTEDARSSLEFVSNFGGDSVYAERARMDLASGDYAEDVTGGKV